jgi:hypothetical protein
MRLTKLLVTTLLGTATVALSRPAAASNPLEFPDNGATAFSRGGAWLATATDPIATHYNPAALATQKSGFSIDLTASFQKVCYDRRNPGNALTGPNQGTNVDAVGTGLVYLPACNDRGGFPKTIPSLAFTWRVSRTVGVGLAMVPPSAYTDAVGAWPELQAGFNTNTGAKVSVPAPYRYLTTDNQSLVFLPTLAVGVEVLPGFRVGAGFIWGIGAVDFTKFDVTSARTDDIGDRAPTNDVRAYLKTQDFFMPGAILSAHWSATENLDLAVWGRYVDAIRTSGGSLEIIGNYFSSTGRPNPVCDPKAKACGNNDATLNEYGDKDFDHFKFFAIPPELRAAVRFHQPRNSTQRRALLEEADATAFPVRDPLHDDLFDIELNGSFTQNSKGRITEVRFPEGPNGTAVLPFAPSGQIPPNADRDLGYKNTLGARLGGQVNAVRDKLALLAGTWFESQAADDKYLNTSPVPAMRGGYGGGLIIRQTPIDFVIGYQRHWAKELDNGGLGASRANSGKLIGDLNGANEFRIGQQPADQQFRSTQFINGGRLTQSAHVFTMGVVWRF